MRHPSLNMDFEFPYYRREIAIVVRRLPDAQVVFDHGNGVVYDGWKDFDARPVTVQVWEFDTGATIAIVGHADHASLG